MGDTDAGADLRREFVQAVISKAGCPYRWGASGPDAFDCCGLVEWGMNQIGISLGDIASKDLYEIYHQKKVLEPAALPGSLWLYSGAGNQNVSHVMIMIERWAPGRGALIGARGGGPTTLTIEKAWEHRAFVDVVMTDYWHPNLVFVVDPFL
ncbi:MAG TPA: NlpC/P60 family protein [Acidobacteriota bacterium]|nr:NlpC/P60 family protein [Acidobacteriota bacterium]